MNDRKIKIILNLNLLMAFFSVSAQGLSLLQRSIYLFDVGMKKDIYGYLLFVAAIAMFFIQLFIGPWSDRGKNRKLIVIIFSSLVNLAANIGFLLLSDLTLLAVSLIFTLIGFQTMFNMMRVLVASVSDKETTSSNLATFQLVCAAAYAIFSLAYGYIVEWVGFKALFASATALAFLTSVVSVVLFISVGKTKEIVAAPESSAKKVSFKAAYSFAPQVMLIFGLYLFVVIAQYGTFNYILHYFKSVGGADDIMAGWILAVACFLEVPAMYIMGRFFKTHDKEKYIIILLILAASRWILFAFVTNPVFYFPIHSLRVLMMGVMFVAMSALIMEYVPANRAGAAMGMLGALGSIGNAVGPAAMGVLVEYVSIQAGMLIMAGMVIVPTIAFAFVYKYFEHHNKDNKVKETT